MTSALETIGLHKRFSVLIVRTTFTSGSRPVRATR
jgi:hypothetical protein